MKMRKLIAILSLALLTLTLTKSAKVKDDVKKSNDITKMMPDDDKDMKSEVDMMEMMSQCNETFRIEMAYLQSLNESGSFPDETDKTPKCFIRCMLEMLGVASEDGQYDATVAAAVLPAERGGRTMDVLPMATACAVRTEACKCDRAYQFMKCLMEMEIENYEKGQ